jgi:hypothetical protein
VAWDLAHVAERVLGAGAARRTARVVGWFEGASDGGVHRVALRVSPRLADQNPGLVKISPQWAAAVAVRRQGLRWQLDLRDNLQAVLYYAGRYEPAVRRFLVSELRSGGATRTLKRLQPRAVLVEDKRSDSSARLHAVLDECGYRPTGEVLDRNAVFRPELRG